VVFSYIDIQINNHASTEKNAANTTSARLHSYFFHINSQAKTNLSYISALMHSNGPATSAFFPASPMKPVDGARVQVFPDGQKSNDIKIFNSAAAVAAVRHAFSERWIKDMFECGPRLDAIEARTWQVASA
jgi:hypothetical protein